MFKVPLLTTLVIMYTDLTDYEHAHSKVSDVGLTYSQRTVS